MNKRSSIIPIGRIALGWLSVLALAALALGLAILTSHAGIAGGGPVCTSFLPC